MGFGVLPLSVEVDREVVIAGRCAGVDFAQQVAVDFEDLLEQGPGLGVLGLPDQPIGLTSQSGLIPIGLPILPGSHGDLSKGFDVPYGIDRLIVLRPLDARSQGGELLGAGDRLVPAIVLDRPVDLLAQLLGTPGVIAGEGAEPAGGVVDGAGVWPGTPKPARARVGQVRSPRACSTWGASARRPAATRVNPFIDDAWFRDGMPAAPGTP